jgi:hypothetical protein
MSKLGIRSVALLLIAATTLVAAGIGLGAYFQSPEEAALRKPPTVVPITDQVRQEVLEDSISFRAEIVPAARSPLGFAGSLEGRVVTAVDVMPGQDLAFGKAVIEVEGRPVIVLPGNLPTWRDFSRTMPAGPDVAQLQAALRKLGVYHGRVTGLFNRRTLVATRGLYRQLGYRAPAGPGMPQEELVFAPRAMARVSRVALAGGDRLSAGAIEVTSAEYRIDAELSADGRSALRSGIAIQLLPDQEGAVWTSMIKEVLTLDSSDGPGQPNTGILVRDAIPNPDSGERTFRVVVAATSQPVLTAAAGAVHLSSNGEPYVVRLEGASERLINVTVGLVTADRIEVQPVAPATLVRNDLLVLNPRL